MMTEDTLGYDLHRFLERVEVMGGGGANFIMDGSYDMPDMVSGFRVSR